MSEVPPPQIESYPDLAGQEVASNAFDQPILRDELIFLRQKQVDAEKKGNVQAAKSLQADQLNVLDTHGSVSDELGIPEEDWAPAQIVDDEVYGYWQGRIAHNQAMKAAAFDEANAPRYEALQGFWQEMVQSHKKGAQAYTDLYQMTSKMPMDQATGLDLLAMAKLRKEMEKSIHPSISAEDYSFIQGEIADLDKQREQQGLPRLQDDPKQRNWVRGLTMLVGTGGPEAILKRDDPYEEGKEEWNLESVTTGMWGAAVEFADQMGMMVNGSFKAGYNAASWVTGIDKGEAPDLWSSATLDENGKVIHVGGRFPLPELVAAGLRTFSDQESDLYVPAAIRAELDSLPGLREGIDGDLMGAYYGVSSVAANLMSVFGVQMPAARAVGNVAMNARKVKALESVRNGMKGLAWLKTPTGKAVGIRKAIGTLAGGSTFGVMQGMATGNPEDFGKAFWHGLGLYGTISFFGAVGDKLEKFLHAGAPRGVAWTAGARGVRHFAEAIGIGPAGMVTGVHLTPLFDFDTEEGRLFRAFLNNPSMESWSLVQNSVIETGLMDFAIPFLSGRSTSKQIKAELKAERLTPEVQAKITEPPERQAKTTVPEKELPKYEQEGLELLLPDTALRAYRQMGELVKAKGELAKEAEKRGHPFRPEKGIFADSGETIQVGVRGAKVVKTDRLMDRMIGVAQRSAGKKGARLDTEFAVSVGRNPETGEIYFGAAKGEAKQVDMAPSVDRMRAAAKQHGVDVGNNTFSLHMHPGADPFSIKDVGTYEDFFWKGDDTSPHGVVGSQGVYVVEPIKPKAERTEPKADEFVDDSVQQMRQWLKGPEAEGSFRPEVLDRLREMPHEEMVNNLVAYENGQAVDNPTLWGTISRASQLLSQKGWEQAGYRVGFFDSGSAQGLLDTWARTGQIDWAKQGSPLDFLKAEQGAVREVEVQREGERAAARDAGQPEFLPMRPEIKDINKEMTEAGRLEKVMMAPDPGDVRPKAMTVEKGVEALDKWFGENQATYAQSAANFKAKAKAAVTSIASGFGKYFHPNKEKRQAFRKAAAHRIRAVGYGKQFLSLGADEKMVKLATDEMRVKIGNAEKMARLIRSKIFEPQLSAKDLSKEQRFSEMSRVLDYAALRDLDANYIKEIKDPETGDVIGQQELQNPLDIPIESVREKLAELEGSLNSRERAAYANLRGSLDSAFQSMVDRGLATEDMRRPDYFPHHITDWDDAFPHQIGTKPAPKEPFRANLLGRKGSKRTFDVSARAVQDYLTRVEVDNAKHDFMHTVGRQMQQRLLAERGLEGVDFDTLNADEWQALNQDFIDDGLAILNTKFGKTGAQKVERDPLLHKMMSDIATITGTPIIPEVVVGRNMRPGDGSYLVTREYLEFLRQSQHTSNLANMPILRTANKLIGKWFKGPALRGFFGTAGPARAGRNMMSDLHGIYVKGAGLRGVMGTLKNIPSAKRVIQAFRTKDVNPDIVNKLSDYELSILQEMESRGTLQINVRGQEFARSDPVETEWMKKMMPETTGGLARTLSQMYRADFKWAKTLDDYSENLFRVGYFMRERMARFEQLREQGMDAPEASRLAGEDAHIRTGEVLINYNHLTPLERHAFNGVIFPFYTWAKGNFTGTMAALAEKPLATSVKAVLATAPLVAWNLMVAKEEEERLWHANPWIASKPHLILPWVRDEFGNPMVLQFESTTGEAMKFLGLDQLADDTMQMLVSHKDGRILAKDIVPGVFENASKSWQSFVAPWIRGVGAQVFSSEFVTPGERGKQLLERDLPQVSRPWADLQAMAEWGKRERSTGERWAKFAPFIGYVDITKGVTGEQLPMHYEAGRIQRREAQISNSIKNNMKRFVAGLKGGDGDDMLRAVDRVWDVHGEQLQLLGMEKVHLVSRFLRGAEKRLREEALIEAGGPFSPKWLQLSRTQKTEVLLRMMEQETTK